MHETTLILLFVVATAVAIAARRLKIPYTVALVAAGLLLGGLHVPEPIHLTKELLFALFLPGLLFEAAFHIEFEDFWRDRVAILGLAVPGVVAAIALTTIVLEPAAQGLGLAAEFTWQHALVFSALIAATDPIAVVALFKSLGAPRRLGMLVEGESLLNDGTSIVFFTLILGLVGGNNLSLGGLVFDFARIVGGGAVIGGVVGIGVSQVIRSVDDPMIEITLTTIAAYGSFVAAEQLGYSGVIATVAAGMLCGNYGARTGMSPSTRVAAETFWEYIAFALNSLVFLLIGLEVRLDTLWGSLPIILVAYFSVTIGRALVIFGASGLLHLARSRVPRQWNLVLTWGGLRGALSMVLVLGLPTSFEHRELMITITFGVVVLSILVQGLTMAPLLRALGIVGAQETRLAYELARGQLQAASAALTEIDNLKNSRLASPPVLDAVTTHYQGFVQNAEKRIEELHLEREQLRDEELHETRRHLLMVEKERVIEARHRGTMSQETQDRLLADIDARLLRLESGEDAD
ncbi:MAG TPA: sodium:proton antiporter [Terriglobia bacterium]|nr:sodium:proton antiporter [Terriglobia bacterium]